MQSMRAVQVSRSGGEFELVEREIPEPEHGQVRVKVEACGICHSDAFVKEGLWPGIEYPRVPGHEVAGAIDKVGEGVVAWKQGQRVGVGWHGGHCFQCEPCRDGDFVNCVKHRVTGVTHDGGYAEYTIVPEEALAHIPNELNAASAAPLLCAGITTYNALRNSGARAGDIVAVQGIGGLGHLGIQFANKLGFKTIAVSHGKAKEKLALDLGADIYIDTESVNAAEVLANLGGARVVLATAPSSKAISDLVNGLGRNGKIVVVAATGEPMEVSPLQLIPGRKSIQGWPSGHAKDSEDALDFSALRGIQPMIETFPLEKVAEAYQRMMTNMARFRVVLQIT
ncbi:MAG: alcohol dehydrogenase catalytic domain-containing protein [Proteobacteria bacterium]|nr:alcohol dehydrogenase catalytic domain-containing protein [Pseudomonadota bacterium]NIS67449.1 alcohol dehydrogenase catalytic domain-containing protein [Pseudomonadota bacterium]